MCGIAGIIRKESCVSVEEISGITEAMIHRGPDSGGVFTKYNYAIGHRRLSIIDLSNGRQPMHTEDNLYHITYNGELYNYLELKKKLEDKGMVFLTSSDTEVVLKAYVLWGDECVNRFRGMFAFAIADDVKRQFFICRDYLGIKPVVVYQDDECIAFASEIQALKKLNSFDKRIDIQAIDQYLAFQYIPAPRTIYSHAMKLRPGHYMTLKYDMEVSEQISYYEYDFDENASEYCVDEAEYLANLDEVLEESIEKHLISDVDYGAFLSGGIDSSLVVDYMSRILDRPVQTFSIGFADDDDSELTFSKLAAKINKTEHHVQIIGGDAIKILPDLVKHYGEPFGDSSAVPTYYVSKLASNYVKMVLSGDGADEQFAGYWNYTGLVRNKKIPTRRNILRYLREIKNIFSGEKTAYEFDFWEIMGLVTYYSLPIRKKLWKSVYKVDYIGNVRHYYNHYEKIKKYGTIRKAQYFDLKEYLPSAILTKVDIASMMSSLEVRTPYIDRKVLECALNIPLNLNLYSRDNKIQGKMLLKKLLENKYPKDFLYRNKRGFSMPLHLWFYDPENYAYEKRMNLLSKQAKINEYFNPVVVKNIVMEKYTGRIWLLVFLEEWLEQNA